jgi:hypothetical protein
MESNRELKVTRNISGCQLMIRDERRRTDRPSYNRKLWIA